MASQPSGASSTNRARMSSVSRIRQGAPGVSCSPAMNPSASQRCSVEGAKPSWLAASVTVSSSPSGGAVSAWWQGMCQWWRSDWTLPAVNDNPRAVRRSCRLRMCAITASG